MLNELAEILPEHLNFKDAIGVAENFIRELPQQIIPEVINHFAPGIYAREMRIPAGTILTGKIHKTEHLCILNGDIDIASQEGAGRFTGYLTFLSKPGIKRIGYAHEDTVFTTIHAIEGTDIPTLEDELTVETFEQYEQYRLITLRNDYDQFVEELGMSQEAIKTLVEYEGDQIPMPEGYEKLKQQPSTIHGSGMFAVVDIEAGEFIAPARLNNKRTPAGRYTNHSPTPNACMQPDDVGGLNLVAIRNISQDEEVTVDYRQVKLVNGYQRGAA